MYIIVLQRLFLEAIFDVIYFPLWWYTGGIRHALSWCFGMLRNGGRVLAPGLWLKNIFVPMYGQYDFQGRLISFFMRSVNAMGRSVMLFFWFSICLFLFLLWLLMPIFIIYEIVQSFIKM